MNYRQLSLFDDVNFREINRMDGSLGCLAVLDESELKEKVAG